MRTPYTVGGCPVCGEEAVVKFADNHEEDDLKIHHYECSVCGGSISVWYEWMPTILYYEHENEERIISHDYDIECDKEFNCFITERHEEERE